MLRIGEAAREFHISKRTLRYWEDEGILHSDRQENGYRYYDDENCNRIRQIVLLRSLWLPIGEIERILKAGEPALALSVLQDHVKQLEAETASTAALATVLNSWLAGLTAAPGLPELFSGLAEEITLVDKAQLAPQNQLIRRKQVMNNKAERIRFVRIPKMTVASYRAVSESPENDCSKVMNAFVCDNNLHKRSGFRHFGFNNPNPAPDRKDYGYEIWVTVPEDMEIPEPLVKKQVTGGLYASISTTMGEIGERWMQLYNRVQADAQYEMDTERQWLEECVDFEAFLADTNVQLDLLAPIREKKQSQ